MAAKFFVVLSLAVAASAIPVLPSYEKVVYGEAEAPAHYQFEYSIQDDHSGDIKQQKEIREGDVVHGSYSLVQPDGVQRVVEYTADKVHGFNAVVNYDGKPIAEPAKIAYAAAPVAEPAKIAYAAAPVAKIAYAAPVTKLAYASPFTKVAYAAPITKVAYSAPITKIAYDAAPLTHVTFASPAISYHH